MKNKIIKFAVAAALSLVFSPLLISAPITVDTAAVVNTNTCDKISWTDSSGLARTGSIVKINGNPSGYKGGYFSQVTYMDGAVPVTCNESGAAGDLSGLGFMINHQPAGYAGRGWANSKQDGFNGTTTILFQGANHVIYQTEMDEYADNGNPGLGSWKVKWIYMIRTGNDYIVDSIAYDFSSKPFGTYGNDIRSPYCEMNWTGTGAANTGSESIDGIEYCASNNAGTSYIFKTRSSSPFSDGYTYNTPGRNIPYTMEWKNSPDREAGYVSTLDLTQQAAGGGYLGQSYVGSTCTVMPQNWGINFQSNGFQGWMGNKMTWGLPYGAAGGETAAQSGSTTKNTFPDWTWRKNWPAYPTNGFTLLIQLGKKTDDNVRKLVSESADIHGLTNPLSASVGTVVTTGKSNLYDAAAFTLKPAGYNHLYHAWEVNCAADAANVTLSLGAVSLKNQTFIFNNFNGGSVPVVTAGGVLQAEGADMFTSLDTVNKKLYVTFNKLFTASTSIIIGGAPPAPTLTWTPTPYAGTPTMTPTAGAGRQYCVNVDYSAVPALVNKRKLTLKVDVGTCSSVAVTADGSPIPAVYKSAAGEAVFTTSGSFIVVTAVNWTSGGTGAVAKAVLQDDHHWAFSQTFDDEYLTQYTEGKPLLDAKGWKAGIAVTGSFASAAWGPMMSWLQMEELWASGWDMYNHSYTHPNLNCTNFASEFQTNQTALQSHFPGYNVTHIVYPFEDTACTACGGFPPAYLLSGQRGVGVPSTYVDVPIADLFKINRTGEYGSDLTSCKTEAAAAAANARPTWIIKITHNVYPGNTMGSDTLYSTTHDALSDLYDYLDNNFGAAGDGSMWFAPAGEVMDYIFTRDNAVVSTCVLGTPTPTFTNCAACTATFTRTFTPTRTSTPLTSDCLMDDMDDGNTQNNFNGYWFSYAVGAGAVLVPPVFAMASGGYNSSPYAARLNGTVGIAADNSQVVMATQLNQNAGAPANGGTGQVTDLSACSGGGLSFYAKGDGKQYYVKIPYTNVNDGTLTGYNDYKAPFTAPATWTLVTIPFSAFTQDTGWGTIVSWSTVLANVKTFQFLNAFNAPSGTTTADLWVDNLYVTSCSACPGAPANTPVNTATRTPTASFTRIATASFTRTATPVITGTSTWTSTSVITATYTPTATSTRTSTLISTFTSTSTRTGTRTPVNTATDTFTRTATPTATVTGTVTDSPTETPYAGTPTDTWTDSPTPTITETQTATGTYTVTMTITPTLTVTETEITAYTATRTGTRTVTMTNTALPAFTDTATPTCTNTQPQATPTFTHTAGSGYDCVNFTIDRSLVPAMVFMKKLTLKVNVGDCASVMVFVDGLPVSSYYNPASKTVRFTADGANVQIMRAGYTGGATNAVTKATLLDDKKWAYSFTFDDARISQKTNAAPILDAYGYRAGIALNTQSMNPTVDGWAMSWLSADALRAKGWSFFDHNYSHQVVTCANISTETLPVITSIDSRWGPSYKCTHFVYPYVNISNWTCIRDSGLLLSAENFSGSNYADTVPPNLFILNRNGLYGENTAAFNSLADNAAADARPRWLINFTHDVEAASPPVDTYSTNIAAFGAHIAYVFYKYGEGGLDNMWFAPSDEVMHYILTRQNAAVNFAGTGACGALTPVTPTVTRTPRPTMTGTAIVIITATSTPTTTPAAVPTAAVLAFLTAEPMLSFPNPGIANTPVAISFTITRAAASVTMKIYTTAQRCVRTITKNPAEMSANGSTGGLNAGRNVMRVRWPEVSSLAGGIYYYVLFVEDNETKGVRSNIEKLIILK